MGKRGPLPKKAGLKVQSGKLPMNKAALTELLSQYEPPECPEHLTDDERTVWNTTVELLRPTRGLDPKDQAILAAYCNSYVQWVKAEKDIQKIAKDNQISGLVMKSINGLMINPLVTISRRAKADTIFYASQLGMTPTSRGRVNMNTGNLVRQNPFRMLKAENEKELDANSKGLRQIIKAEEAVR
jgi:P27 family predicted phage terminase small subunit